LRKAKFFPTLSVAALTRILSPILAAFKYLASSKISIINSDGGPVWWMVKRKGVSSMHTMEETIDWKHILFWMRAVKVL
jgi:hypothetical protein